MSKIYSSKTIDIRAGATAELAMMMNEANIFFIINRSSEDVYIRINGLPRVDNYDKVIKRNSSGLIGRPMQVGRIAFYNPSSSNITIEVQYTYDTNFDYSILHDPQLQLDGDGLGFSGEITAVRSGVVMGTHDADVLAVLNNMYLLQAQEANTNATILEGINTLLKTL